MIVVDFFTNKKDDYCKKLDENVLKKIEKEMNVHVNRIDFNSKKNKKLLQKWKRFCNTIGYEVTPVVMVGSYLFMPSWGKPITWDFIEMQLRRKIELMKNVLEQQA